MKKVTRQPLHDLQAMNVANYSGCSCASTASFNSFQHLFPSWVAHAW
jgi:hypothetical protein